jgi:hypothetical protein
VRFEDKEEDLKKLRLENGDRILDVDSYFINILHKFIITV